MTGDLVVVAPVVPTREAALRRHLRSLDPSPLKDFRYETHFARFVILPVDGPQLFFSSRFDVAPESYIGALSRLPAAATIWAHCQSADDLTHPEALRGYLTRHRLRSPYILPAWAKVSVGEINEALRVRARLSELVVAAPALGAVGLAHAFRETFVQ